LCAGEALLRLAHVLQQCPRSPRSSRQNVWLARVAQKLNEQAVKDVRRLSRTSRLLAGRLSVASQSSGVEGQLVADLHANGGRLVYLLGCVRGNNADGTFSVVWWDDGDSLERNREVLDGQELW
jgi:hypothetical protein